MQRPGGDPADPPSPPGPPDDPAGRPAGVPGDRAGVPAGSPWAPQSPGPQSPGPQPAGPQQPYPGPPAGAGPHWPAPPPGPSAPGAGAAHGDGAFQGWPGQPVERRAWPPTRRELTAALLTVAGLALLGAALAVLWQQLAPRPEFRVVQPGRAVPVVPEAEEYVAADGRFVLLTLAAGVAAGVACWLLRRTRGPVVLAALAVGGLLGAVVTWRVGVWLAPGYSPADLQEVGRTVTEPLALRARAALVVEPVAAVVVYLLAAGFTVHNDLGVEDGPVS